MAFIFCINTVQAQVNKGSKDQKDIPSVINISVVKDGETTIQYMENGASHKAKLNGSKLVELFIDGKKIPETDFPKYESQIKKIVEQMEADREQAEKEMAAAEIKKEHAAERQVEVNKMKKETEKDAAQAKKEAANAERDRARAEEERKKAIKERERKENL